jgi:hypothetical protein
MNRIKRIIKEELLGEAKIKVGKDEYIKLFEDKTIMALKPLTHQASCKYGSGTKWCVTMRDTDEWWENYTKKTSRFAGMNWYSHIEEVEETLERTWLDKLLGRPAEVIKKEVEQFVNEFPVGILYFVIVKKRITGYNYNEELKYNEPIYEPADPKDPMNKLALLYKPSRADEGDLSLSDKFDSYNYISEKLDAAHNNMSIFNALDQKVTLREVSKHLGKQFGAPFNFIEEDFQKERNAIDKIVSKQLDKVYPLLGGEGSKHSGDKYKEPTTWIRDRDGVLQAVPTSRIKTNKKGGLSWSRGDATNYKGGAW